MKKNVLYLIVTIISVTIVALLFGGKEADHTSTAVSNALPQNGLVGGNKAEATLDEIREAAQRAAKGEEVGTLPAAPAPASENVIENTDNLTAEPNNP